MATETFSFELTDIATAAARICLYAKDYSVWSFEGEMGAGKTTLISAICQYLGVKDEVSSPTYALLNEYHLGTQENANIIYHADWYRIKNAVDARDAGLDNVLYKKNSYAFVEWASMAPELLHHTFVQISLSYLSETQRQVKLQTLDALKP